MRGLPSYLLLIDVTCAITIGVSALKMTPLITSPLPLLYYYDMVFIHLKSKEGFLAIYVRRKEIKISITTIGLVPNRDARMVLQIFSGR